ncbi:hypothetical protein [Streptomyces sp. NPDC005322]|uniref:hypothetical protein n=1 Tax=Streptomyces sp. NPDC005322 TaxID=3157032 RepID=UPI0033AC4717
MTAAMVAPNPVTIGLAVGTGLVYGGAKVVEHWKDIKEGGREHATLHVAGNAVAMTRNSLGLRQSARALRLTYQDRTFSYRSLGPTKGAVLTGENVEIALGPGRHVRKAGLVTAVEVSGDVDALALALAIVFEEVETASLTLTGAALMAPVRLINHQGTEPTAE